MNTHPELAQLMAVANLRHPNAQADQKRKLCDGITAAKDALHEHLAKLATQETLRLTLALVDAETAANVEHESTTAALLGPKRAA